MSRFRSRRNRKVVPLVLALLAAIIPILSVSRASNRTSSSHQTSSRPASTFAPRGSATVARSAPSATKAEASNRADPGLRRIGFASRRGLETHWEKHGSEFGSPSLDAYLAMAQHLRDAPLSTRVVEAPQSNGSYARFDRTTGAFLAFNRDLTIRTFFRPDDGESYFRRAVSR